MPLTRLVYCSRNKIPGAGNVAAELKKILASAIRNNVRHTVTGGLVFNRNYFLQVLEGERSIVSQVFTTISGDPRHDQIELVDMQAVNGRLFGAWSMGFASTPELIKELWEQFGLQGDFNPKLLTSDQIVKLIYDLVNKEEGFASSRNASMV